MCPRTEALNNSCFLMVTLVIIDRRVDINGNGSLCLSYFIQVSMSKLVSIDRQTFPEAAPY